MIVLVELSVLAKWLARKTPLRKPNRGEGIVSRKPRPKSVYDFLGLFCCFIVLLCICVVSCPYVIYYPTVMAQYSLFVLKVPLNPKQTNKQIYLSHVCNSVSGFTMCLCYSFFTWLLLSVTTFLFWVANAVYTHYNLPACVTQPVDVLLYCVLASCGAVYCNRSCLWVCVCVCLWVCYHDKSKLRASILTKLGL